MDITGFESAMIDPVKFFNLFVWSPLKFVGAILLLVVIVRIVYCLITHNRLGANLYAFPAMFFHVAMFILYGVAVYYSFFYDFDKSTTRFSLPDKMYLTTFFVGAFSLYESISHFVAIIMQFPALIKSNSNE